MIFKASFWISVLLVVTLLHQAHCSSHETCDIGGIKPDILTSFQKMLEDEITKMRQMGQMRHNPAESCQDILDLKTCHESGQYWLKTKSQSSNIASGAVHRFHCDMTVRCCGSNGGWARIAHINMKHANRTSCPGELTLTTIQGKRLCQRATENRCTSANFSTHGMKYTQVCGKVIGYQFATTNAFGSGTETTKSTRSIDEPYVDGVSITHGLNPRKHIWTFAAAFDAVPTQDDSEWVCPCTANNIIYQGHVPTFVNTSYFCETGSRTTVSETTYYMDDPLWDAKGCGAGSTCCDAYDEPGHPYFCKRLPQPTTDDIELRVCLDQEKSNEDVLLEQIEIYIK